MPSILTLSTYKRLCRKDAPLEKLAEEYGLELETCQQIRHGQLDQELALLLISQQLGKLPSTQHPQVTIAHRATSASVDEGMAELISGCWKLDIETFYSCQDNAGQAYVMMEAGGATRFFKALTEHYAADDPIVRAVRRLRSQPGKEREWELEIDCFDNEWLERMNHHQGIIARVTVRFPAIMLPEVSKRIGAVAKQEER